VYNYTHTLTLITPTRPHKPNLHLTKIRRVNAALNLCIFKHVLNSISLLILLEMEVEWEWEWNWHWNLCCDTWTELCECVFVYVCV